VKLTKIAHTRRRPSEAALEPVAHEVGHGELAELPEVGRQQQREQHVPAGPAHEVDRPKVAGERDDARHPDERRGGHPVGPGRHPVGERGHALARDVELAGGPGPRPDRDADIEREADAHEQEGPALDIEPDRGERAAVCHRVHLSPPAARAAIEPVHEHDVHRDEHEEDVDRALLGEPEAELRLADAELVLSGSTNRIPHPKLDTNQMIEQDGEVLRLVRQYREAASCAAGGVLGGGASAMVVILCWCTRRPETGEPGVCVSTKRPRDSGAV
jgi:hypothetical protein